ncbi:MAG: hypothetical protein PUF72_10435 [Clostridiales bacterium]|nr:hypothetical protein [Clostridiales bacterium]
MLYSVVDLQSLSEHLGATPYCKQSGVYILAVYFMYILISTHKDLYAQQQLAERDTEEEAIRVKLDDISEILAKKGYSISAGLYKQKLPASIPALIKQAEVLMFEDKKSHYATPR